MTTHLLFPSRDELYENRSQFIAIAPQFAINFGDVLLRADGSAILSVVDADYPQELLNLFATIQQLETTFEGSIDEAKTLKKAEIYTYIGDRLQKNITRYSQAEQNTWVIQEREAYAYQASQNPADAPYLTVIATAAGITLEVQVQRVITKVEKLQETTAKLLGIRTKCVSELEAKTSIKEVIEYPYISLIDTLM